MRLLKCSECETKARSGTKLYKDTKDGELKCWMHLSSQGKKDVEFDNKNKRRK